MFNKIDPQFLYYVLLFILTIVLRFIRTYREKPKDKTSEVAKIYWKKYLYFGFELVNVSAGVFILLSERSVNYVATFMILYVILVVISFFLEEENVGSGLKLGGNIMVTLAVLIVTYYAFIGSSETKKEAVQVIKQTTAWMVALPYIDTTINRNFAPKDELLRSIFISHVEANTREEALAIAKQKFYSESGPKPFLAKTEKSVINMIALDAEAVLENKK